MNLPNETLRAISLAWDRCHYALEMARHSTDPGLSEHDRSVLRRREEHGWFVNKILPDDKGPGFVYSFGLYEEFQHPEIIIFGLDLAIMHRLINDLCSQLRKGTRYSQGDVTRDLLKGYSCAFRRVNPLRYRETCTWAVWFYEHSNFPTLQLFWPDKENKFPWEPGFDESIRSMQPDLSEPPVSS